MLKCVVLISGGGSNLAAVLQATDEPGFPASVVAVGSDTDAPGLEFARERGIPTFTVRPSDFDSRNAWGEALSGLIMAHGVDGGPGGLVVSAGFMRILPENMIEHFSPRIINTHPALLPLYPGAHAVRDALADGATETGATVHVIDAGVDTGPVLRQVSVPIRPGQSEENLHETIKRLERPMLVDAIRDIALGDLTLPNRSET